MLSGVDELLALVAAIYGPPGPPKGLRKFWKARAVREVQRGGDPKVIAKTVKTSIKSLRELAVSDDPVKAVFGKSLAEAAEPTAMEYGRRNLGQMLPGQLAERVFADVFDRTLGSAGLKLRDERHEQSETDFVVLDPSGNDLMRLNVKFHGTQFRDAAAQVNLPLEDCFGLATYKIIQGVQNQTKEGLLHAYAVVSVPSLAAELAGTIVPVNMVHLASLVRIAPRSGRTHVEDAITRHLIEDEQPEDVTRSIADFAARIRGAEWRMLSVNKAFYLLRELLTDRVFAVKVPRFAQMYKNAEVNMHFSLSNDLTPFGKVVHILNTEYVQGLTYQMSSHVKDPKPKV